MTDEDYDPSWRVQVEPPQNMSYREWAETVLAASRNADQNSENLKYKLLGGDEGITSGNCHVATVQLIRDAGGEILMSLDPPGWEPGLNQQP